MENIRNVDLNLLLVFHRLCRERNVSRVAQQLGLSQPALSHALRRLRQQFGDELFVRAARGVVPTRKALALEERVARLIEGVEDVLRDSHGFDANSATGRLVIATTDYLEMLVGGAITRLLQTEAPGVQVVFRPTGGELPKRELEGGDVDIAAAGFYGQLPQGYFRQRLFEDSFSCAMRSDLAPAGATLSLESYIEHDHILISFSGDLEGKVDQELRKRKTRRRVLVGTASFTSPAWIMSGADVVLTAPTRLLGKFAEHFPIKIFPVPLDVGSIQIHQVWHARTDRDPLAAWFRAKLHELFATPEPTRKPGRRRKP